MDINRLDENYQMNKINIENNDVKTSTSYSSGYFNIFSNKKKGSERHKINDYSYKLEINNQLIFKKEEQNKNIDLKIFNNGEKKWIENQTFLIINGNLNFKNETISLAPLAPNESQEIKIPLKENNYLSKGKYNMEVEFKVNNSKYGNSFQIVFEIQ